MDAEEMIQEIVKSPPLTYAHQRARISLLRNLVAVARTQCGYAHNTEHTYTKENQWRKIHHAAVVAYKTLTNEDLPPFLQSLPE